MMHEQCDPINLKVVRFELDFSQLAPVSPKHKKHRKKIVVPTVNRFGSRQKRTIPAPPVRNCDHPSRGVNELVEELLDELYAGQREWSTSSTTACSYGSTAQSFVSSHSNCGEQRDAMERNYLESLDIEELRQQSAEWTATLHATGVRLAKCVRARDRLRRQQKRLCAAFTVLLRQITGEPDLRFGVSPSEGPGEGGFLEWLHAMRLVARLPAGVPTHFRKKLWLTLSDRHLTARSIDWPAAERACFRGTALPDDAELGAQILKDLHRTGCSLFCGAEGRENQGMLRRVLLAYARWNKDVGYCQGFNMIAAIILEVMEKSEADSLKVMIYLVEAVLPEGYFADDLRGLSADMAAFRDLLRLRLPRLANHMDNLQRISDGGGVEPPLPDVFTMQWFLTLYATWLPRDSLLRIWDLVMLDGNEILLLTALAIWDLLQDRILAARSADEFYSCMGGGSGVIYEAGDALVARVVAFGSAPELPRLRNLHRYKVTPPALPSTAPVYQPPINTAVQTMTKKGLRLFYSEDEGDSSDDGNRMALATVIPRRADRSGTGDRLSLDIGALKRQYARLRERQRQAHVILAAACARHAAVGVPTSPTSLTVNNLLLGKSAIVSHRGRRLGPPPGAVPPSRHTSSSSEKTENQTRARPSDTISWNEEKNLKTLIRRSSLKWKDIKKDIVEKVRKPSIDFDETGDGVIVSEREANEMIASLRPRSSSESSSYSSHNESSSDTSLCDDNIRDSDSEPELPDDNVVISAKQKRDDSEIFFLHQQKGNDEVKIPNLKEPKIIELSNMQNLNNTTDDICAAILRKSEISNVPSSLELSDDKPVKDISDYLDSAAGEPLRTYIDGFETKLKDSLIVSDETKSFNPVKPLKFISPIKPVSPLIEPVSPYKIDSSYIPSVHSPQTEISHQLKTPKYDTISKSHGSINTTCTVKAKRFTDLSPIDLTPSEFGLSCASIRVNDFLISLKNPSTYKKDVISRPPDIIDSLTRYPNFVPDLDLSDKNISDIDSPPRSPGAESMIVSEDEPPIPLKIDKYFEYSPDFFGARLTDANNADIPNRRSIKRNIRLSKKPDSLNLHTSNTVKNEKEEPERASSLPQSHSLTDNDHFNNESLDTKDNSAAEKSELAGIDVYPGMSDNELLSIAIETEKSDKYEFVISPKDYIIQSGRKNSERALQIIQENSKILRRILTKQNISEQNPSGVSHCYQTILTRTVDSTTSKEIQLPILKESSSDSLIGTRIYRKRETHDPINKYDVKVRPISIDDPFSSEIRNTLSKREITNFKKTPSVESFPNKNNKYDIKIRPISIDDPCSLEIRNTSPKSEITNINKTPSVESFPNKTDLCGWENKGFLAKYKYGVDSELTVDRTKSETDYDLKFSRQNLDSSIFKINVETKPVVPLEWDKQSTYFESKTSVTLPSPDTKTLSYDRKYISDDYKYPLSKKYSDYVLSEASNICSKTVEQGPKICEKLSKTDNSQFSDFAHVVTSSISFTYDPSCEEDSPVGAKSNSSDTLCQIASLDQVSTPMSPKVFPKDTPTLPKDFLDKSDRPSRTETESDDTCSAITSLIETDTLSSLSYPRSPSTGSYHPFPTRPALRVPKELGVRLGMYPKDVLSLSPK